MKSISPVTIDPECSEAIHIDAENLNASIAEHNQKMTELKNDQHEFRKVEELDSQHLALSRTFGEREVEILQAEKKLREQVIEFDTQHRKELSQLHDVAHNASEKLKKSIRSKLIKIGYIDAGKTDNIPGKVRDEWILFHPEVIKARGRLTELQTRSQSHELRRNHETELNRIEKRLDAIRQTLVSI